MPKRNVEKTLVEEGYYHIYNKGIAKKSIFKRKEDYEAFEDFLNRYLNGGLFQDKYDREYHTYRGKLEIISFCLLPKKFHILIKQSGQKNAISGLMRSLANSYTSYFNKTHRKSGPVFEGTYKASLIDNPDFLVHISRHIILQSDKYTRWPYSSLPYLLGQKHAEWIDIKLMQEVLAKTPSTYLAFLADSEGYENSLKYLNGVLADK